MQETYPTIFERLTISRCNCKGSTFSRVILRPWVLFRSEARTLVLWRSINWANQMAILTSERTRVAQWRERSPPSNGPSSKSPTEPAWYVVWLFSCAHPGLEVFLRIFRFYFLPKIDQDSRMFNNELIRALECYIRWGLRRAKHSTPLELIPVSPNIPNCNTKFSITAKKASIMGISCL